MATLEITEYLYAPARAGALPQLVRGQQVVPCQQVTVGAASDASDPFNARTEMIIVTADVDCRVAVGAEGATTAVNSGALTRKLFADREYPFDVEPGQVIAVIEMEA